MVRDVLDHLRADDGIEGVGREGQGEDAPLGQARVPVAEESKLGQQDIHPDRVGEILDDPARSAPDVQDRMLPLPRGRIQESQDDPMAGSLPVPLQRDGAVEGAAVVVRRGHRVPELPHADQRLEVCPSELEEAGVGSARPAREVPEGQFANAKAQGMDFDQDLLQNVKVPRPALEALQDVPAIHAKAAGDILHRQ